MTDASTRGRNNRAKGAENERTVAKLLFAELGIGFKRNLSQTQEAGHGDLTADDPAWPFCCEVKRRTSGANCLSAWEVQSYEAAKKAGQLPCVIYSIGNQGWKVRIWMDAMSEALGSGKIGGAHMDMSIQGFAWVAREIMARRAKV